MNGIKFEEFRVEYLPEVLGIYTYYVLNTTATFHAHALTAEEMGKYVLFESPKYKTFVVIDKDAVCGYVILTGHNNREAYDRTAEVSIYLQQEYIGKGIGSLAVQYIENYAEQQNMHVLIATICGENDKSIRLFERNGYTKCAHYKEVGTKFDKLLDIVAYQKILQE